MASWGVAFWSHAVIRTRFFADYLIKAAGDGIRQLVLLAAGLDTRAFRLPWPDGVRLYELDLREVLRFKDRVLAARTVIARCERTVVPVDLREDWPGVLIDAGLQTGEPTAWLAEGLVIYLTAAETVDLLTRLGQLSAASSSLAFELENLGTMRCALAPSRRRRGTSTPGSGRAGFRTRPNWLAEHGWRSTVQSREVAAAGYGRPEAVSSTGGFVVATRV